MSRFLPLVSHVAESCSVGQLTGKQLGALDSNSVSLRSESDASAFISVASFWRTVSTSGS